jgi:hypothetical protein
MIGTHRLQQALVNLATMKRPISAARVKEAVVEARAQVKSYKVCYHQSEVLKALLCFRATTVLTHTPCACNCWLVRIAYIQYVVHAIEKFLKHAEPPLRMGIVYLIDALCKLERGSKGHKSSGESSSELFSQRFEKRMKNETLLQLRAVPHSDRYALQCHIKFNEVSR